MLKRLGSRCATALSGGQKIVGTYARGHQRLMRVAKRGVRDQQALFLARPRRELFRSGLLQQLPRAGGWLDARHARQDRRLQAFGDLLSLDLRVAVENYVAQIGEQLGGAVAAGGDAKKLRRIVEKRGGNFAGAESRVIDDILQETEYWS